MHVVTQADPTHNPVFFHLFSPLQTTGITLGAELRDIPLAWQFGDVHTAHVGIGDLSIVGAQLLQSLQFVVEERLLLSFPIPAMLVVGLEGASGLLMWSVAAPFLHGKLPMQEYHFEVVPSAMELLQEPF